MQKILFSRPLCCKDWVIRITTMSSQVTSKLPRNLDLQ